MYQHPIPQNVTGYQFRLIGDMTITQFGWILGGGIIAVIFYFTNLPVIIKWPLIVFFAFLGVAIAFFKIEDRSLDHWIKAFLIAIYRPTQYYWRKNNNMPEYFAFTASTESLSAPSAEEKNYSAMKKQEGLASYMQSLGDDPSQQRITQMDEFEQAQLRFIDSMIGDETYFSSQTSQEVQTTTAPGRIMNTAVEENLAMQEELLQNVQQMNQASQETPDIFEEVSQDLQEVQTEPATPVERDPFDEPLVDSNIKSGQKSGDIFTAS